MRGRATFFALLRVRTMTADTSLLVEDDPTLLDQALAKSKAGSPQPCLSGRKAQSVALGVVGLANTFQIAPPDNVGIGLRAIRQCAADAVDQAVDGFGRFELHRDIGGLLGHESLRSTLLVDPLVTGDPIQPRPRRVQIAEVLGVFQCLDVDTLEQIARRFTIFAVLEQKTPEFLAMRLPGGFDAGVSLRFGCHSHYRPMATVEALAAACPPPMPATVARVKTPVC